MDNVIQWLNVNNGTITATLTLISVLATVVMAGLMVWANRISARNIAVAIELEKQRSRPVVIFDIIQKNNMAYAILKNIGQSPAVEVEVKVDPMPKALANPSSPVAVPRDEREINFLTNKIPFLAPAHELSAYLSLFYEFIRDGSRCNFSGTIHYHDITGTSYEENFNLNPSIYAAPLIIGDKNVTDCLEQMIKSLDNIQKSIERVKH